MKNNLLKMIIPGFLWNVVENNPELKKIIANINWLFFDKVVQMVLAFFIGVWVIRYLGPEKYGILSYAVAFTALFGILSKLGLEAILVRELVDNKIEKEKLLGTTFLIKLAGSLLAIILSTVIIFFMRGNDIIITFIALIISLSFIFQSFDVIDYWFQSQIASKFVVYSRSVASILSGIIKVCLILAGASLTFFAYIILLESILISIGLIFTYKKNKQKIKLWEIDFFVAKKLLNDSWPLALSAFSVIIYMKIDQVMIGNMLNNEALGNYSAAVALSEVWYFVPVIVAGTVFPAIIYARKLNKKLYLQRLQYLYDFMTWSAIIVAIPVAFFSKSIINLLYGTEFLQAAPVLAINIWAGAAVFLGSASSKFLVAENLTKISFYRTAIGAIINIALNFALIPIYGIIGAAFATLISYFVATFSLIFFKEARVNILMFIRTINIFRIIKILKTNL